jgi:hypothetical protein
MGVAVVDTTAKLGSARCIGSRTSEVVGTAALISWAAVAMVMAWDAFLMHGRCDLTMTDAARVSRPPLTVTI